MLEANKTTPTAQNRPPFKHSEINTVGGGYRKQVYCPIEAADIAEDMGVKIDDLKQRIGTDCVVLEQDDVPRLVGMEMAGHDYRCESNVDAAMFRVFRKLLSVMPQQEAKGMQDGFRAGYHVGVRAMLVHLLGASRMTEEEYVNEVQADFNKLYGPGNVKALPAGDPTVTTADDEFDPED